MYHLVLTSLRAGRGRAAEAGLTLANYTAVFTSGANLEVVWNTVIYAVGSSVLALVAGTALAWLVERTDAPFKGLAYTAAFASFAIPGVIKGIGWILLLGPESGWINTAFRSVFGVHTVMNVFSMGGMVLVEGLLWTPVVFLLMATPFRSMDPSLEEAGIMSGARPQAVFRRIVLPLARPMVLAALLLTLIRTIESFEVPLLLGVPSDTPVLATQVYNAIKSSLVPEYGVAAAYAVLMLIGVMALLIPYTLLTRDTEKFSTVTGKGFRPRIMALEKRRPLAALATLLLPLLVVAPMAPLFWASFQAFYVPPSWEALARLTLQNYPKAFSHSDVSASFTNTLIVSAAAATACMVLAMLAAWVMSRTKVPYRASLDYLATLPLVFPGIVASLAVLRAYIAIPIPIYGTLWILILAYVMRRMPYAIRYGHSGILQIHKELEESAEMSGASWLAVIRRIVLPLMLPALFSGWVFVFLISMRELPLAIMLYSPGNEVLAVSILDLWENGHVTELSAFSVAITGILVAMSLVLYRVSRGYGLRI
jgi:iron(III) transport system permease protein